MSDDVHLFAGYDDGSLRKWNLEESNCVLNASKLRKDKGSKECLLWTLRLFNDAFLISGDSLGEVTVWDAVHGTQLQTFNQLKADIFALEVNTVNSIVYASGADSRVLALQLTNSKG